MTRTNCHIGAHMNVRVFTAAVALNSGLVCWAGGPPSVGPQIRIDVGGGTASANEHSTAADQSLPASVVATWNDYRQNPNIRMGVGVSINGGATWSDFLVRPPVPNQATVEATR